MQLDSQRSHLLQGVRSAPPLSACPLCSMQLEEGLLPGKAQECFLNVGTAPGAFVGVKLVCFHRDRRGVGKGFLEVGTRLRG